MLQPGDRFGDGFSLRHRFELRGPISVFQKRRVFTTLVGWIFGSIASGLNKPKSGLLQEMMTPYFSL
jgi:hypothetical protein